MRNKIKSTISITILSIAITISPLASVTNSISTVTEAKAKKVYYVPGSSYAYHSIKSCRTLSRSRNIKKVSLKKAKAMGLKACKVCH